jgi:predicted ester cyclase
MPKQYANLVHEWFEEVWNQRNTQTIDRLMADDALFHGIPSENGEPQRGPQAFKDFHRQFLQAFPNVKIEVLDALVDGDKLAVRCVVHARHDGNGLGLSATGKETTFTGICIAHVKDGKIVEAWNNFDFLGMHMQLGTLAALQPPALA